MQRGTQLGSYEILSPLGKGGMGEVWRARDSKLGREVAIKTLPEEFAKDEERLARFEREAKLLASLNHPNIAAIYGLEEDSGTRFLVLELVEGDTLADRLKRGAIPVEESLKLALQIAEALEAAHEKGVIHRDLKPGNIKVTPDGKVKVLDFGLAKAFAGDGSDVNLSQSPTLSLAATQQGVILGTAAYMAPEQARGQEVDKRADVWAFGCVLYEMLTGRQAFKGELMSDVMASVLARDPDYTALQTNLHPKISELIRRCLAKEPKQRWHDIGDVRFEIEVALADPAGLSVQALHGGRRQGRLRLVLPWVLASVFATVTIAYLTRPPRPLALPTRFEIETEGQLPILLPMVLSPDGRRLVYRANDQLYVRRMDRIEATPLAGTEGARSAFFSPDGQWIGFFTRTQLKKINVNDGVTIELASVVRGLAGNWISQDVILFGRGGPSDLLRVSANGGTPEPFAVRGNYVDLEYPELLPGGQWVLFTASTVLNAWNDAHIVAQSVETGDRKVVLEGGYDARYVPTGHLIYARDGLLMAVGFDLEQLETVGSPQPVVVNIEADHTLGATTFDVATDGTLVFLPDSGGGDNRTLALVDRNGKVEPLGIRPGPYVAPRVSPDGSQVAVQTLEPDGRSAIWVYDLSGETSIRPLTLEQDGNNSRPVWTHDSKHLTFASDRDGATSIYRQPVDGGAAERLTAAEEGVAHLPESWSRDGNVLSFRREEGPDHDIWTLFLDTGDEKPFASDLGSRQDGSSFSPDGEWLAYWSEEVGLQGIYVQPFPPTGNKFPIISNEPAVFPLWSPDGQRLIFRSSAPGRGLLTSVDVTTERGFPEFGSPEPLPVEDFVTVVYFRSYDILPDGERFIVVMPEQGSVGRARSSKINVILNWFEELKERVPVQ